MKKKSKKWLIWLIVILVPIVFISFNLLSGSNEKENGRRTVKVTKLNIVDKALAVGSIEPVNEIDVKSKVSGVVGKLFADVGDFVDQYINKIIPEAIRFNYSYTELKNSGDSTVQVLP